MKTADEYLKEQLPHHITKGGRLRMVRSEWVVKYMEQYAKQQAVNFLIRDMDVSNPKELRQYYEEVYDEFINQK